MSVEELRDTNGNEILGRGEVVAAHALASVLELFLFIDGDVGVIGGEVTNKFSSGIGEAVSSAAAKVIEVLAFIMVKRSIDDRLLGELPAVLLLAQGCEGG